MDPKRSSEMRHGTGGPLLAIVALPMAVDFCEFEHFRAGAALSFRQLENAIRTDFQSRFTQNLKLRFFPNFVNGHK